MPSFRAGKQMADCDLLDTYSYLCYQMPGVCLAAKDPQLEDPQLG
jgi:hypothetical protein